MLLASSMCDWDKLQRQSPNSKRHCACGSMTRMLRKIFASCWPGIHEAVRRRAEILSARICARSSDSFARPVRFESEERTPSDDLAYIPPDARPKITRTDGSCFNTPSVVNRPVWSISRRLQLDIGDMVVVPTGLIFTFCGIREPVTHTYR